MKTFFATVTNYGGRFILTAVNKSVPHLQLNNLVGDLGEGHVVADEEELIVPMLGNLLASHIDGAEGMGKVLPAGGVQVRGWLVEEGNAGADSLQ